MGLAKIFFICIIQCHILMNEGTKEFMMEKAGNQLQAKRKNLGIRRISLPEAQWKTVLDLDSSTSCGT